MFIQIFPLVLDAMFAGQNISTHACYALDKDGNVWLSVGAGSFFMLAVGSPAPVQQPFSSPGTGKPF